MVPLSVSLLGTTVSPPESRSLARRGWVWEGGGGLESCLRARCVSAQTCLVELCLLKVLVSFLCVGSSQS